MSNRASTSAAGESTLEENPGTRRPVAEADLVGLVWIADPQISPDGSRVAFTRVWVDEAADEYVTQIWIVGESAEARAFSSGLNDSQPRWSPDGSNLALVRRIEPGKPPQIHVLPAHGGEARKLTALEGGATDPAWSPDGTRIAFLSGHHPTLDGPGRIKPKHEPGRVVTRPVWRENNVGFHDDDHRDHVWVISVSEGEARPLTRGPFADGAPCWARDGMHILFLADRRTEPWFGLEENQLFAVRADLPSPTDGADLILAVDYPGWATAFRELPDRRIALIGAVVTEAHSYDQPRLLLTREAWPTSAVRAVAPAHDFPFGEDINSDQHPPRGGGSTPFAVTPDGRHAIVTVGRHGSSFLTEVDLESGAARELNATGLDIVAGTATADGRRWALVVGSHHTPGDLERRDIASERGVTLVAPNRSWQDAVDLGEVEEFWYPSFDGRQIQGWIVKPPQFDPARRYPLVLEIHGGPHTAYGAGFFHEFQVLAGAGYIVLYTNPRGSTTYGQAFANVIQYRFPDDDARDLLAAVDAVVARGYVDPERLGVTGGSGGGLLTNWLIAHSDRFRAAVTQRCVSEWPGMYSSADFAMFSPFWFRQPPFQDPAAWAERSPMTWVERIHTPLMVIHSEEDWRTPIAQGEAIFRALKQLRRSTVMIRFPGENHELSRSGVPSRRVQNQLHIRRWFDRWLLGKPAPEYGV